jgi:hypothetical protein
VSDLQSPALYVPAETTVSEEPASRASLILGHVLSGIGAARWRTYTSSVTLLSLVIPTPCVGRRI